MKERNINQPPTVLIIDDHTLIGEALRSIFEFGFGMSSHISLLGKDGLKYLSENTVNFIALDIRLPDCDGLSILEEIRRKYEKIPVLIISSVTDKYTIERAFELGASGFSAKTDKVDDLEYAVKMVLAGQKYLSKSIQSTKGEETRELLHERLSKQEYGIFLLLAQGKSRALIAEQIDISKNSFDTYRHRILAKMEMSSTYEIIRYASEHNLLP